jgi:hypothetical protein
MSWIYKGFPQDIDEQTADLIIRLQRADAESYSSSHKGKSREGEFSDEGLAFQLYKQELESIAYAIQTDRQISMDTVSQGYVAKRDCDVAHRLTEGAAISNTENPETNSKAQLQHDGSLTKLATLYVSGPKESQQVGRLDSGGNGDVEPFSCAATRVNPSSVSRLCEACWEERKSFDVIRLPCRHEYCGGCLEDIYRASMTDESRYPPRCCRQDIPITLAQPFLSSQLVQDFKKKKIEFETPNRTYCWSPKCSAFICAQNIRGEVATCLDCGSRTCTICKVAAHKGDCPNDTALQQLLRSAAKNGWQRCYSCSRVVELSYGCYHMTSVPLSIALCHYRY